MNLTEELSKRSEPKTTHCKLGQLLVDSGDLAIEQLALALRVQRVRGGLLGSILQEMGACKAASITRALNAQMAAERVQLDVPVMRAKKPLPVAPRPSDLLEKLDITAKPRCTIACLLLCDITALLLAGTISGAFFFLNTYTSGLTLLAPAAIVLAFFLVSFAVYHLYDCVALGPAEELRRTSMIITFIYAAVGAGTYFFAADGPSKTVIAVAWLLSLFLVPLGRTLVRGLFAHKKWWGNPVIILGAGKTGQMIVRTLQRQPGIGLKPVAMLDDDLAKQGVIGADGLLGTFEKSGMSARRNCVQNVPVIGGLNMASSVAKRFNIPYGIVAMPSVRHDELLNLLERHASAFSHLLIIPELFDFSTLHVPSRDVGGVLGLEVRQQLLLPGPRLAKRVMDLALTLLGGVFVLPLIAVIAVLIKLDSKGPIFYIQERLGKNGTRFRAVKFRTMFGDGERILKQVLDSNPALREEYRVYHKLKNDPRVTRVGRVLRKYSLDEFPQLWNVLKGEMSLVGPRPYLEREIPEMNERESIILQAQPGMTGMWQVSVRNETAFSHRLKMDVYYVRNWCPWLDLHILARTAQVVARGTGS